jgi:hypothetical protein
MNLEDIFNRYNIALMENEKHRHPVDILEDMYLKLNIEEYRSLMELIAQTEAREGFIFDISRGRNYP